MSRNKTPITLLVTGLFLGFGVGITFRQKSHTSEKIDLSGEVVLTKYGVKDDNYSNGNWEIHRLQPMTVVSDDGGYKYLSKGMDGTTRWKLSLADGKTTLFLQE